MLQLLTEVQIKKLFTEPFSDLTLRYANALHSAINSYHDLLKNAPVDYVVPVLNRRFLLSALDAVAQYTVVHSIIIDNELEVFNIYQSLIEQETKWSILKDITLLLLSKTSIL